MNRQVPVRVLRLVAAGFAIFFAGLGIACWILYFVHEPAHATGFLIAGVLCPFEVAIWMYLYRFQARRGIKVEGK